MSHSGHWKWLTKCRERRFVPQKCKNAPPHQIMSASLPFLIAVSLFAKFTKINVTSNDIPHCHLWCHCLYYLNKKIGKLNNKD